MMNKNKIFLAGALCLAGLAGFMVSTNYSDMDGIISAYRTTTNGSFFRKHLRVVEDVELGIDVEQGEESSGVVSTGMPSDLNLDSWINYIKASKLSDTRKAIVLEGFKVVQRGVVYHGMRGSGDTPDMCDMGRRPGGNEDGEWYPGSTSYDFNTQANFNVTDPLYLDCSFFIKHCYYIGGQNILGTNTGSIDGSGDFIRIDPSELVPGDIAVKSGSHVMMFIGYDTSGQKCWSELSSHKNDAILSTGEVRSGYVCRRLQTLMNDTEFVGATAGTTVPGTSGTTGTVAGQNETLHWNDGWAFAKSDMKHPDSLTKYVPDNYNGHTVFLNPGHGDGTSMSSAIPNDPYANIQNQYTSASGGHSSGTYYTTTAGKTVQEAQYVLDVCTSAKDKLLAKGYAVIMSRESLVNNFENSARSIWANNVADIHVAVHIDSGTAGPGWYRPTSAQKQQENYASWASQGEKLGTALENALSSTLGLPITTGRQGVLTGYCYSTIPCAYIELYGVESKTMADFADSHIEQSAQGIVDGVDVYFN